MVQSVVEMLIAAHALGSNQELLQIGINNGFDYRILKKKMWRHQKGILAAHDIRESLVRMEIIFA